MGFKVFKNGWPDFLVTTADGKLGSLIEYKSTDSLSKSQKKLHRALAGVGLPVAVVREKNLDTFVKSIPVDSHNKLKADFAGAVCKVVIEGVIEELQRNATTAGR